MKYGYAVEYDYAPPTQLLPSLETKRVSIPSDRGTSRGGKADARQFIRVGFTQAAELVEGRP